MIPALLVFVYLAVVLYIGIFAFRGTAGDGCEAEDYFLAGRSLGPMVFLLSLFGTNMTAFTILGSAGHAFANGIVTFGLMASSSAFVIPLTLFFVGTRHVGARQAPRLHDPGADVPRSVGVRAHRHGDLRGAGRAARALHHHRRDGRRHGARAITGGLRAVLARRRHRRAGRDELRVLRRHARHGLGQHFSDSALPVVRRRRARGHRARDGRLRRRHGIAARVARDGAASDARARSRRSFFFSYTFIPLSTIAFPHITIFCLTAQAHGAVPADGHLLSALHPGHLAALRVPRRRRQRHARRAAHRAEARGARRRSRPRRRR